MLRDWRDVTRQSNPGNVGGGCLWVGSALMLLACALASVLYAWTFLFG